MVSILITFFLDFFARLLVMASIYSVAYLVWLLYQQRRRSPRPTYSSRFLPATNKRSEEQQPKRSLSSTPQPIAYTHTPSPSRQQVFNSYLESRLISLLNGDVRTAQRLVKNVHNSNPGRSPDWCLEKVIYDLERDRR